MSKDRSITRYNAKIGRRLLADIRENGFAWNEYGKIDPTASSAIRNIAFHKKRIYERKRLI